MSSKTRRKRGKDVEEGPSEEWLEFESRWVHYDLLHLRVENAKMLDELGSELKRFALFCFIFYTYLIQTSMVSTRYSQKELFEHKFAEHPFVSQNIQTTLSSDNNDSYIPRAVRTSYKNWYGVSSISDIYGWMDQVLYPTVWGEESKRLNYSVAHGNQFLWGVRLRQLRTKSSDALIKDEVCKFPDFSNIMDRGSLEAGYEDICHPVYGHFGFYDGKKVKDTAPYGNLMENGKLEYQYSSAHKTNGSVILSHDLYLPRDISDYDGGGYIKVLPLNGTRAKHILDEIAGRQICEECQKTINGTEVHPIPFLDSRTRLLVITIQTYSVNTNMFTNFKLIAEFTGSGEILTSSRFMADTILLLSLDSPHLPDNYFLSAFLEIVTTCWVVSYTLSILISLRDYGIRDVTLWSFYELGIYILFLILEIDHALTQGIPREQRLIRLKLREPDNFFSLHDILEHKMHNERLKAVLAICIILRSFKFLTIINSLDILSGTIKQQFEFIQAFFLAVLTMLFGYSMAAYLIFGQDDEFYSTLSLSFGSLVYAMTSSFEAKETPTLAEGMFTYLFIFFNCHLFLFVIVAIMVNGWRIKVEEKEKAVREGKDMSTVDPFMDFIDLLMGLYKDGLYNVSLYLRHLLYQHTLRICCTRSGFCGMLNAVFCSWRRVGQNMKVGQVLYRLQRWKKRPENVDALYMNFDMIKKAMIGDARIKRIVDDYEVGSTMALCYEDSEARSGYRFLLSTEEKDIAEKMERSNEPREQKKDLPSVKHGEIVKMMWKSMQIMHDSLKADTAKIDEIIQEIQMAEDENYTRAYLLAERSKDTAPQKEEMLE